MNSSVNTIFRVMLVCTGNTCRSPMAEGILRDMAKSEGLGNMDVISAGVATYDGYPPSTNAVTAAAEDGVDISMLHSTQLVDDLVKESDLILTMASDHYEKILAMFPQYSDKLYMLKGFPENVAEPGMSVGDPIGLDLVEYRKTYSEIKAELKRIWPYIKKWYEDKIKG